MKANTGIGPDIEYVKWTDIGFIYDANLGQVNVAVTD
jgi:hypothetical protein